jgi:tRNA(fMet)-specific endonuclease VapC
MTRSLLDTDIVSYYLRGDQDVVSNVQEYLKQHPILNISYITWFEILSGLEYKRARRQIQEFEEFVQNCQLFNISESSIHRSAVVSGQLRRSGITIGNSDLLISGIALEHDLMLITNNEKHFRQVPGLKVGNWKIKTA